MTNDSKLYVAFILVIHIVTFLLGLVAVFATPPVIMYAFTGSVLFMLLGFVPAIICTVGYVIWYPKLLYVRRP